MTLREVCGLTTQAVARAFLVSEEALAQRVVRAKKKIRDAGIPYETPEPPMFDERIQGVLAVVYSVFTEGYAATAGPELINTELCAEAIRLGRLLDALLPKNSPVIELNHAVALSMVDGAARALDLIDSLAARGQVTEYHLLDAARGRLLQQLGRSDAALDAYREALRTAATEPERRLLATRIASLEGSPTQG